MFIVNRIDESSYVGTVALMVLALTVAGFLLGLVVDAVFPAEAPDATSREEASIAESDTRSGITDQVFRQYLEERRTSQNRQNTVQTIVGFVLIFLWGWIYNKAVLFAGGLKVSLGPGPFMYEVTGVDAAQAFKTGGMVAIIGGLIAAIPSSLSVSLLQVILAAALGGIIAGLLGGIILMLQALAYNLAARFAGGLEFRLERGPAYGRESDYFNVVEVRYVRVSSALRTGLLVALMELALVTVIALAIGSGSFAEMVRLLTGSPQPGGFVVLLFMLLVWPIQALIYNFLALRNGGLQLEVEGQWPEPAAAT